MNDRLDELRRNISSLSNEALLEMVETKSSDFTSEALNFAREEVARRGGIHSIKQQILKDKIEPPKAPPTASDSHEQNKYPALYTISTVLKTSAYVLAIAELAIGALSLSQSGSLLVLLISVVSSAVTFICFLAVSELIVLFVDIANSTRISKELLRKSLARQE